MRRGTRAILIGLLLLATAFVGLARDVPWIAQPFYAWAWWGWILVLDGFCVRRRGASLLTTHVRLVPAIAVASISFWFAFEALNLRFRNWYYVGCFHLQTWVDVVACGAFVAAAFATVFLGIFETIDALGAAGAWRQWAGRARRFPGWVSWAVQLLGLAMATTALLWPTYLAPLVWGSLSFLLDPWNHRAGRRSLLRDLERGEYGRVARVFVGGLVCGLVWESLNFFAPQKWIYTVRGLEDVKLFEMPLLGFLGFPALALDCIATFSLFSGSVLGNRTWEHPADGGGALAVRPHRLRAFWATLPLQLAAWAAVALGVQGVNVCSVRLTLEHLPSLPDGSVEALQGLGISQPTPLLEALEGPRRDEVLAALGLDETAGGALADEIRLYSFKGLGRWNGYLLGTVGVRRVEQLAAWSAEDLHAALRERAEEHALWVPRLDWVRVWVSASRSRGVWLHEDRERP